MTAPIDFVLTWVDGGDPAWQAVRRQYRPAGETDDRQERYRDWDNLQYWFRGVERFAPWVEKIHFVTFGHLPPWLNTEHPRLRIVRHEDYLPPEALPTFNSNVLELNLHRIPELAEHFVYFNDDVFLLRAVKPETFFRGGLPRDMLALQPVIANPRNPVMSAILLNNALAVSRHFQKREVLLRRPGKAFRPGYPPKYFFYNLLELAFPQYTGFYTVHGPSPLRKSTCRELWEQERETLEAVTLNRFRSREDVNQYLFREWEKQRGSFVPGNLHREFRYLNVTDTDDRWLRVIRERKKSIVCINDASEPFDFEGTRQRVIDAFQAILPEPSAFERT